MGTDADADDRIDLPTDFAEHLAAAGNVETPPETLAECLSMFADQLAASDRTLDAEDLYTENATRHEVHANDRVRYSPCVLDALSAAVMEPQTPVTVRSVDPVTSVPVTFTVGSDTVEATPEDALVTFGMAPTVPALESGDESVFAWVLREDSEGVEDAFCRFINAFESADTFGRWAAETEAKAVPVRPEAMGSLIRRYVAFD